MHSEKSNISNPAHHLAQTLCQLVGSLLHIQQSLCQDACTGVAGIVAAKNDVSKAGAVASDAKTGRRCGKGVVTGIGIPGGQLLCSFISVTARQVPEADRAS